MIDEYFIETASEKQWQMWLNQWRHTYKIEILAAARGAQNAKLEAMPARNN